jgi:Zn-dependent M28 family amino/carboxypeptidase
MQYRRSIYSSLGSALLLALILAGGLFYMTHMPGKPHSGALPPLSVGETQLADDLRQHIAVLAGDIGERNIWRGDTLDATADYIEKTLQASGYAVSSQSFTAQGKDVRNLEVVLDGSSRAEESVVIGAHYDTVSGSPGANDNGSGIAALLEIARLLSDRTLARSVRLVAFVNEEAPFFYTWEMGSHRYARRARERGDKITAMLSLETIGYYADAKGSQRFPNPVYSWLYPDTGNFIGFVGNVGSRKLVRQCLRSFRSHTAFPAEGVAAPGNMTGIHWSDHWSFWQEGYPALMVTDTAPFRYPHYHASTDTPDKIDYQRLARVVSGLARLTADLAQPGP